jgi:hypothetical protein
MPNLPLAWGVVALILPSVKFVQIIFQNSVPILQKTHCISSANAIWLMSFKKLGVTAVYSAKHTKLMNSTGKMQFGIKAGNLRAVRNAG